MEPEINFKPTLKQDKVFEMFNDEKTTEIVYGGSLRSGKTHLLAALMCLKCLEYPGIRVAVGRNVIAKIKSSILVNIIEVLDGWKLKNGTHYKYNSTSGEITFSTGSKILFVALAYRPSDPNYITLGGEQFTFGVIDEATEVEEKGKSIFQTRIGRYKNAEYKIKPILIMTCNPSKSSFIYRDFYKPWKEGRLEDHQQFIQALPEDNTYNSPGYLENLRKTLSLTERRRLLDGEWELEDSPNSLFKSTDVALMYDSSIILDQDTTMRISADIAFTSDKCILIVWSGLTVKKIVSIPQGSTVIDTIKRLAEEYGVKPNNVCWDADGVGKYIKQYFPSGTEIHNGAKTIANHGYSNLKTELYFKLSELVAAGKVKIEDHSFSKDIDEELAVIKHKPKENMTNKIELISKGQMKRELGHSPDISDALAYGMVFQLKAPLTASSFDFIGF